MSNIETYDQEAARLCSIAIRNPTNENIDAFVKAAIKSADKMSEYIIDMDKNNV
jgi:hypothetical protein